jgi:hypothetical protein
VFVGNLLARTQRARITEAAPDAVVFAVDIAARGEASEGTLTVTTPGEEPLVRQVEADTCGEVVAALALVAALTVDPEAETAPLTSAAVDLATSSVVETAEAVEPTPEPPPEPELAPPEPELAPPEQLAPPEPKPPPTLLPVVPTEPKRGGLEFGVGAQVERDEAVFDRPIVGWRGFVELGSRRGEVIRPSVGLSFVYAGERDDESDLGNAKLAWFAGRLDLCPVDLASAGRVTVRPCVAFDVGSVVGRGEAKEGQELDAHTARFTWASGALLGRADFDPWGPLLLRLEAALVVPFVSEASFVLRSGSVVDEVAAVPSAGLALGAGVGVRFP